MGKRTVDVLFKQIRIPDFLAPREQEGTHVSTLHSKAGLTPSHCAPAPGRGPGSKHASPPCLPALPLPTPGPRGMGPGRYTDSGGTRSQV